MKLNLYSKILKAGLKGSAFFILLTGLQARAEWAGLFEGEGRSQKATFNNCDVTFDLFIDAKKEYFVAPQLAFWCAMPDGSNLIRNQNTVKVRIHPNGDLRTDLGTFVGTYTEDYLFLKTFDSTPTHYEFFKHADGTRTAKVTDLVSGEIIEAEID
ncbi:MAG: hypothetical protein AABZ31_01205 [Bdellovibrionota bacterium]